MEWLAPHDLLRLNRASDLVSATRTLPWVAEALARAPWVVVRRAPWSVGLAPVGVRGRSRSQRFAAYLPLEAIAEQVTPERLAQTHAWTSSHAIDENAVRALDDAAAAFDGLRTAWGPAGSIGFALATGRPAATASSDLDLIVRSPLRLPLPTARWALDALSRSALRPDIQLETPAGAVSLAEYARGELPLLCRTAEGPRLIADPWDPCLGGGV